MEEKLLIKIQLKQILTENFISGIAFWGYKDTGNKFSIQFNGSKGYLSNIVIECEGRQKEGANVIWAEKYLTKGGTLRNKTVHIYHSEENGIRIEI